jgi:putative DNA-invertase from lambdoid prophage Rac
VKRIAYYRTSTLDQSVESQRQALGGRFEREFVDAGVSGAIPAASRPAFGELLNYVRDEDHLCVYAVDRLGRDALDVQSTVRALLKKGVTIEVLGLGVIAEGAGELILAVLAQIADMEKTRIVERCEAGRVAAREALRATGLTHRGKASLGRPKASDPAQVVAWRHENMASARETANHFSISVPTVARYCAAAA